MGDSAAADVVCVSLCPDTVLRLGLDPSSVPLHVVVYERRGAKARAVTHIESTVRVRLRRLHGPGPRGAVGLLLDDFKRTPGIASCWASLTPAVREAFERWDPARMISWDGVRRRLCARLPVGGGGVGGGVGDGWAGGRCCRSPRVMVGQGGGCVQELPFL